MKSIFFAMALLLLSGCTIEGRIESRANQHKGFFGPYPSKVCVDGIVYLFFKNGYGGGASVQFDGRGMPVECTLEVVK